MNATTTLNKEHVKGEPIMIVAYLCVGVRHYLTKHIMLVKFQPLPIRHYS
jgi:hypothetical protein